MKVRRPWTWLALTGGAGLLLLRFAWPSWPSAMPGCTVRRLTGLHCPGCGGTRSAVKLLEGDFAGAAMMNPAVFLLALAFAGVVLAGVWQEWRGGKGPVFPAWLAWGAGGLVLVFGLVRNLPWWPFTVLVPP
jgi:hypothetical protein